MEGGREERGEERRRKKKEKEKEKRKEEVMKVKEVEDRGRVLCAHSRMKKVRVAVLSVTHRGPVREGVKWRRKGQGIWGGAARRAPTSI